jgi:hypothetical protein
VSFLVCYRTRDVAYVETLCDCFQATDDHNEHLQERTNDVYPLTEILELSLVFVAFEALNNDLNVCAVCVSVLWMLRGALARSIPFAVRTCLMCIIS